MTSVAAPNTYVIASGDFTTWGGMDRANYELAWHLADRADARVHLVGYFVAAPLSSHPNVTWHRVPKPWGAYLLADPLLARAGRRVARRLAPGGARVVVNGGNCPWPDVNWVHAVHAAWGNRDADAPMSFRLRAAWSKRRARRAERRAVGVAALVMTNSHTARQQIVDRVGVSPDRVHVVYYGTEPGVFHPAGPAERAAARRRLGWPADRPTARPVVAFIGALGHDRNKGFDVLFRAWQWLSADPWWDADLVVAGGGAEVDLWRHRAEQAGLAQSGRVRVLGFTKQVPDALAAADALVSPTHYDAYGLGVHEALCCGLPAFVTRSAGVAERYPAELGDLLLGDPPDAEDLVTRLRRWRADIAGFRGRVAAFARELRRRTWADMSRDIMSLFQASPCGPAAGRTYCGLSRAANPRL